MTNRLPSWRQIPVLVAFLSLASGAAVAQCLVDPSLETLVLLDGGLAGDEFGAAVATDGSLILVGAPSTDSMGEASGSTHVYDVPGDGPDTALLANGSYEFFGWSVDLSSEVAVIGAIGVNSGASNSGAAFVHDRSDWSLVGTLAAPVPAPGGWFGHSVAVDGPYIVVGALGAGGSAHVFSESNWAREQTLMGAQAGEQFGGAVAVSEDLGLILVSAHVADSSAPEGGLVYGYRLDELGSGDFLPEAPLGAGALAEPGDHFGFSIALDGDTLAVGAPDHSSARGRVHVFRRVGQDWVPEMELMDPLGLPDDQFGISVALSGDVLAVGVWAAALQGVGSVRLFTREAGSWTLTDTYEAVVPGPGDEYGYALDLGPGTLVVGARHRDAEDGTRRDEGAAYVYCLPESNCTNGDDDDGDGSIDCEDADCIEHPDCEDIDMDGTPNETDCSPTDGGAHSIPDEVSRLDVTRTAAGVARLSWEDLTFQAGIGTTYEIAIGTLGDLSSNTALCNVAPATFTHSGEDDLESYWYLVRGVNICGPPDGEGWGTGSEGQSRPVLDASCP